MFEIKIKRERNSERKIKKGEWEKLRERNEREIIDRGEREREREKK